MRRVLVIGSGGAGKSTVAAQFSERLGLPVIHLDALYWQQGWVETSKEEWEQIARELIRRAAWVMDGNYGGTFDLRLAAADTVIFLDLPACSASGASSSAARSSTAGLVPIWHRAARNT